MLRTWAVRLPAIEFTLSVRSFQVPPTPRTWAWPPSLPSVPTSRATRVTSEAKELSWSTMVLMVFLSSRISPFTSTVIFLDRSPLATAVVTSAMLRTCAVRLPAIEFTLSVRSFQVPPTPRTCAWPPSLPSVPTSRATRVTSEAKELSWSTMVLMVFLSSRISPFTSTVIFLLKVAAGHGRRHFGDVADLRRQVARHRVHVVGEVLPGAGHALHLGLAAELALRAHFARDAGHLGGERAQLVHHRVHGPTDPEELAHQRAAFEVERHGLREVALGDRADDAGHLAGRLDQVQDEAVDGVDGRRPGAAGPGQPGPLGDASLLADHDADPVELAGHLLIQLDDVVQRVRDLPGDTGPVDPHARREIALPDGGENGQQLGEVEGVATGCLRAGAGGGGGGSAASGATAIPGRRRPHEGSSCEESGSVDQLSG